jgi:hypothetical protein
VPVNVPDRTTLADAIPVPRLSTRHELAVPQPVDDAVNEPMTGACASRGAVPARTRRRVIRIFFMGVCSFMVEG